MIHNTIKNDNSGDHYGVSINTTMKTVLVQIQEDGEQVRIVLTPQQALDLAVLLTKNAKSVLK